MKKIFSLALLTAMYLPLFAADFTFNDGYLQYHVLPYLNNEVEVSALDKNNLPSTLTIPANVTYNEQNYTVRKIKNGGFSYIYKSDPQIHIIISEGIRVIGDYAFDGMQNLVSVSLPNSLDSIGEAGAFRGTAIEEIVIPANVSYIGDDAFSNCMNLKRATVIPTYLPCRDYDYNYGIHAAGNRLFWGCKNLANVTTGVLLNEMFRECEKLETVEVTSDIYSIPESAFYYSGLKKLILTDNSNIVNIGEMAFYGCLNIKEFNFKSNMTIGEYAFAYSGIEFVVVPDGFYELSRGLFCGCNLKKVTLPASLQKLNAYAFNYWNSDGSVVVIDTVVISDISAWNNVIFEENSNPLNSAKHLYVDHNEISILTIPDGIATFNVGAFRGDHLENIIGLELPESVQTVNSNRCGTFWKNQKWTKLHSETPPQIEIGEASSLPFQGVLLVPCGCIRAYRDADYWTNCVIWDIPYYYELSVSRDFIVDDYYDLGHIDILQKPTCNNNYTLIIEANPRENYHFVQWDDGDTENPRTIQLTDHTYLTAEFAEGEGIETTYINTTGSHRLMKDGQIFILRGDKTYTLTGQEVK